MDLVASCKDKLTYFRIKELKDVLNQLGLSKQGKKQDLVDRILTILSDERVSGMWAKKNSIGKEGVAKLVDDTYRKMQVSGSAELTSKSEAVSDNSNMKLKEEIDDSYPVDKIRCLCGSTLPTDSMIKCEDPKCNVWQHMTCVLIPEKPMEGGLPNPPDIFFCEICRLNRADPFWLTVAHPLLPVKLNITNVPTDGSNPSQSIERTFQLLRSDRDLLSKQEYDIQAWCMLLNDKVTFRMQWPLYADLQINGVPVRAINRPGSQLLGANGRDDGPVITPWTRDGINKIFVSGCDARIFCVGVRIVKKRTLQQVLNMIPGEDEGECFEDALNRVRKCVGGGTATENADDSDSDIEVVADSIPVNLRCPMSGLRMKVAGRFKPCAHMGCFDLEVFVEMNQRSRKWQCPICLKNYSLEKIIIDAYFNRITSKMQNCGEDAAEIEVKPDGTWRVKAENDHRGLGELGLWHSPNGTICAPMETEPKQKMEPKPIKTEVGSDSNAGLRLGMTKNQNGRREINNSDDMQGILPAYRLQENFENDQNIIPMSSSATGSGNFEDASVNQDGGGTLDFSMVNGMEYESISMNINSTHGFSDQIASVPTIDAEVIVLSDSEEEIEPLIPSAVNYNNTGPNNGEVQFPSAQHGIPDSYYENPALGNGGSPSLGLYSAHEDDFGMNMWSLPSSSQGGPGFQLFGSDLDVSDALVEMQHGSLNCPSSLNGYALAAETAMGSAALPADPAAQSSNTTNFDLVDNPLAFNSKDPPLQIFLPTSPSETTVGPSDSRDHPEVPNGVPTEDWISLRLGDGAGVGQTGSAAGNDLNSWQHLESKESTLDPLADNAPLLLGRKDNGSGKTGRERPGSLFSFPRQKRSVRPRFNLSIDTESE
ncbi:E3 SUMO-protein ligase SIZ1-like isoform X1 [Salvia splendens]|uniref:E3 SUMO-protein ligase SIZ1-like isoform X1 n=1 Tax=Salvia splendens TaxID=180675 RepID=UPI001C253067|nr:E3 SUMO-protein ligase SIZ1-like isoform X1 [Salvia splendens]XP_041989869.1 E3 SUMO-protein ligase SIZ1-like isoform X1 [Salvia splendens]